MPISHFAATFGALCYLVAVLLFFALPLADLGRSVIRDAVSDHALGRAAGLFLAYGTIGGTGAASLAFATALTELAAYPLRVPAYLAAIALLRIGLLRFRTDPEGAPATREGRLHYLFAIATFALTYMAIAAAGPATATLAASGFATLLDTLSWTAAGSLVAVVVTSLPVLRGLFGLAERVFLLSTALWMLGLGVALAWPG